MLICWSNVIYGIYLLIHAGIKVKYGKGIFSFIISDNSIRYIPRVNSNMTKYNHITDVMYTAIGREIRHLEQFARVLLPLRTVPRHNQSGT